jgi:DNA-binding NarL/FixJ family response regulator
MRQPTALPSKSPVQVNEISERAFAVPSKERMRVLLFACSPIDAQRALMQGNCVEIAYLPSRDTEEILNEIARFSPQLIACQSDFFIATLQAPHEGKSTDSQHQTTATLPSDAVVSDISPREAKILSMLVQGKTNKEIATRLKLSSRTVKRTLSNLFENFRVSNRTELSNLMGRLLLTIKEE